MAIASCLVGYQHPATKSFLPPTSMPSESNGTRSQLEWKTQHLSLFGPLGKQELVDAALVGRPGTENLGWLDELTY
jgi:hypothetical protein